jgi:hypothetical protein
MHGTIGKMHVMDQTGHTTISWDSDVPIEVRMAKESFEKLTKEGYQAFSVGEDDEQGERLRTFDPHAEKIMMVPQLRGG